MKVNVDGVACLAAAVWVVCCGAACWRYCLAVAALRGLLDAAQSVEPSATAVVSSPCLYGTIEAGSVVSVWWRLISPRRHCQ